MKATRLDLGDISVRLKPAKSEYPGHSRVEVTFSDGYLSDLCDQGWSEDQCDAISDQIFAKMGGARPVIDQQDKEFFTIDVPDGASSDPLADISRALREAAANPTPMDALKEARSGHEAAQARAAQAAEEERAKVRQETSLMRAYKKNPVSDRPADHLGYCIVEQVKVSRAKGISWTEENDFLREDKRLALKPGMVMLRVSLAGDPFKELYGTRTVPLDRPYDSDLQKLIEGLQDPGEIAKVMARPSTRGPNNTAAGETANVLCRESYAPKLVAELQRRYAGLEDPVSEKNTQGFQIAQTAPGPTPASPALEGLTTGRVKSEAGNPSTRQEALNVLNNLQRVNHDDQNERVDLRRLSQNLVGTFLDPQSAAIARSMMAESVALKDTLQVATAFLSQPPQVPAQRWKCTGEGIQALVGSEAQAGAADAALNLLEGELGPEMHGLLGCAAEEEALGRIAGTGLQLLGQNPGLKTPELALAVLDAYPSDAGVHDALYHWGSRNTDAGHGRAVKSEVEALPYGQRGPAVREFLEDLRDGFSTTRTQRRALEGEIATARVSGVQLGQGFVSVGGIRVRARNAG